MMQSEIKRKFKYRVDNPQGRALEAFLHRVQGKHAVQTDINSEVVPALVATDDWNSVKMELSTKGKKKTEFTVLVEYIRQRAAANDRLFFVQLGRALTEGCGRKNAEIEEFLFHNWDRIGGQVDGQPAIMREDIGFKHFTDTAVVAMLEIRFPNRKLSLDAYRQIKKNAALKSEKPARFNGVKKDDRGQIYLVPK